jgi:hypothetical protein
MSNQECENPLTLLKELSFLKDLMPNTTMERKLNPTVLLTKFANEGMRKLRKKLRRLQSRKRAMPNFRHHEIVVSDES